MAKGKAQSKPAGQSKHGKKPEGQNNSQQLSYAELKLFKEFAKERQAEKEKERKRQAKLDARKHANKLLSKFAKNNNLTYKDREDSSSDSSEAESSTESDDESEKRKQKKRIQRRKLKDKQIAKRKAQEDRIRELEETVQELKKQKGSKQQEPRPKKQARSEVTDTSIVTTTDQLKKAVAKQIQGGRLPAGFKLPYPAGAKLSFDTPEDLEEAIDTMVEAAIKKAKAAEPPVIQYDPKALREALATDTPIKTLGEQAATSKESGKSTAKERRSRRAVSFHDDDTEDIPSLEVESDGRISDVDKRTSTLKYNLKQAIGTDAQETLENLKTDAKLRMQHSKISSAHFKQEFHKTVASQVEKLVKGSLQRSKPQVKEAIAELGLERYLEKEDKSTLRDMLQVILCAIRALPNRK